MLPVVLETDVAVMAGAPGPRVCTEVLAETRRDLPFVVRFLTGSAEA